MFTRTITVVACTICAPTLAQAFDVTGGDVSIGHSVFIDDTDIARSSLEGSVELGFGRSFGLQIDAGVHRFNFAGEDTTTLTVHGIYRLGDSTSAGLFIGTDELNDENTTFVGAEVGHEFGRAGVEGYFSIANESGSAGDTIGLSGKFQATDTINVGASLDRVDLGGSDDITRFGLRGDLAVGQQTGLYAEVGSLSADVGGASDSEAFVGVGATFSFGANQGATFDRRGLSRILPGL
jgi:hypothetical protein